jgi:predicted dehydrogenase
MDVIHVGLGTRGRRWLAFVQDHPGMKAVGCVDAVQSTLEWTKSQFANLTDACHTRLEDALTHRKADAAIVASPVPLRAAHAVAALEAGLSVMIERPFAVSVAEAARVLEASRRSGRHVMVAQNCRFARCERTVRQLVREGKVGTVTHVSCVDRRSLPAGNDDRAQTSHVQLIRVAIDHFDTLRSILGLNPTSAIARSTRAPWSQYRHGSTSEAILEMEGGVYVQYHGTLTSSHDEHSLWIDGDKGTLWTNRTHVWWRKRGWPLFVPVLTRKARGGRSRDGMPELLAQLQAATLEKRAPETSGEDNIFTLSMIEAAILSDTTGRVAHVKELLSAAGIRSTSTADVHDAV